MESITATPQNLGFSSLVSFKSKAIGGFHDVASMFVIVPCKFRQPPDVVAPLHRPYGMAHPDQVHLTQGK